MTESNADTTEPQRIDLCLTVTIDSPCPIEEMNDDVAEKALLDWLTTCFPMLVTTGPDVSVAMGVDAFLNDIVIEDYAESFGIAGAIKRGEDAELLSETGLTMADFVEDDDDPNNVRCDHGLPWADNCDRCNEELRGMYQVRHGTSAETVASDGKVGGVSVLRGGKP